MKKNKVSKAVYPGNMGFVEMYQLVRNAPPELASKFTEAVKAGKYQAAIKMLEDYHHIKFNPSIYGKQLAPSKDPTKRRWQTALQGWPLTKGEKPERPGKKMKHVIIQKAQIDTYYRTRKGKREKVTGHVRHVVTVPKAGESLSGYEGHHTLPVGMSIESIDWHLRHLGEGAGTIRDITPEEHKKLTAEQKKRQASGGYGSKIDIGKEEFELSDAQKKKLRKKTILERPIDVTKRTIDEIMQRRIEKAKGVFKFRMRKQELGSEEEKRAHEEHEQTGEWTPSQERMSERAKQRREDYGE